MTQDIEEAGPSSDAATIQPPDAAEALPDGPGGEHETRNNNVDVLDGRERDSQRLTGDVPKKDTKRLMGDVLKRDSKRLTGDVPKRDSSIRFRRKNKKAKKQDSKGLYRPESAAVLTLTTPLPHWWAWFIKTIYGPSCLNRMPAELSSVQLQNDLPPTLKVSSSFLSEYVMKLINI